MTKIYKTLIDPEVPQGGAIRETIVWEASVPGGGEHTFWLVSIYGTGTTPDEILNNKVCGRAIEVTTVGDISRADDVDSVVWDDIPLGTYSCATFIAENYDPVIEEPTTIYDSRVDADVLTVIKPLGAEISTTGFESI